MPQIIPIKDLKNTTMISTLCSQTKEPIYITKNGYGTMVIMDANAYDEKMAMFDIYEKLVHAEDEIREGNVQDAHACLSALREKYDV